MSGEKALLVSSYYISARRIASGFSGDIEFQNSPDRLKPPRFPGQVVGLCGQGGRHPYFRVPAQAVHVALKEIRAFGEPGSDDEMTRAVEKIALICKRLREQTIFDTGTGCVNDKVPALVPQLPPTEIWFEDRQLPMDLWRLISFDLDLVSASISSNAGVSDVGFSSFTPGALAFRALMGRVQRKVVRFEVTLDQFPTSVSPKLSLSVPLARLFLDAGCLLTSASPSTIAQWYPALRYVDWIANNRDLSVRDRLVQKSVDSRYRGLFAEEMAIGMMAVTLDKVFHASPILNTVEYLASKNPGALTDRGLRADFVAKGIRLADKLTCTIAAESKGSLGSRVNNERVNRAKAQAKATTATFPGAGVRVALAFCSSIPFERQKEKADCRVIDPPSEEDGEPIQIDPTLAWRIAYAQSFRFVGLDIAARQVLSGEPVRALSTMGDDQRDLTDDKEDRGSRRHRAEMARQLFGADLVLDAGGGAVALDHRVMALLHERGIPEGHTMEEFIPRDPSRELRGNSFLNHLGIGCVFYDDLERR